MRPCDKLKTLSPLPQCLRPPNLAESLLCGQSHVTNQICYVSATTVTMTTIHGSVFFIQLRASSDKVTKSRDHVALQGHCEKR